MHSTSSVLGTPSEDKCANAANADECLANVLVFIKEARGKA
jgi:hypothetical protein